MSRPDGGPAFPQFIGPRLRAEELTGGMTLRDYFAAKVLASVAAQAVNESVAKGKDQRENLAAVAYGYADAMLAERAK